MKLPRKQISPHDLKTLEPESEATLNPKSEATLNSQIFTIVQPIALQQIKKYVFFEYHIIRYFVLLYPKIKTKLKTYGIYI